MPSITASVVASSIAASLDGDNVAVAVADPSVQIAVSPQPVIAAAGSVSTIGPVAVSVTPGGSQPGAAASVLRLTGGTVSPLILEVEQQVLVA